MIWRILGTLLGALLIVVGIPLTLSPIPLGLVLSVLGVIVLISANPWFARYIRRLRKKSKPVDNALKTAEQVLPEPLADPLRQTEIEDEDEDTETGAKMGPPMHRSHHPRQRR